MQHKKIAKFVPKNKVEKVKKFLIIKKKLQGDLPLAPPPTIIIGTVGLKYIIILLVACCIGIFGPFF